MRASKVKNLISQIKAEAASRKFVYRKVFGRRAKKQYNEIPRNLRHKFSITQLR